MSIKGLKDKNNLIQTTNGFTLKGSAEAVNKNIKDFPTYDDLLVRHSNHFKVKEKIDMLCLF